jgi:hypothetical protein
MMKILLKNTRTTLNIKRKMEKEMKTISKLVLIAMVVLVAGCSQIKRASQDNRVTVTGSGNLISREVALSGFDQVEAGLTFDVTIHQGENFSVVLTSDNNFIEYIQVEQSGRTISFGFKPGYAYDYSGVTLRADVTLPDLTELRLSGNGHAKLNGFKDVKGFVAELSGSSFLEGELNAAKASFNLSGSTYTKMIGSAENLRIDACGNSVADLGSYRAKDAALEVSCNSTSVVNVAGKLDVDASQYSQVFYTGGPTSIVRKVNESGYVGPKK